MFLNNKTISFRLGFLITILLFFEGLLVFFAITQSQDLLNRLDAVARTQLPSTIDLLSAKTNIDNIKSTVVEAILSNQANAKDKIPELSKKTKEIAVEMSSSVKEMAKLNLSDEMKKKVAEFSSEIKKYGEICVSLIEAVQKENWDLILDLNPKFQESFEKLLNQFVFFDENIRENAAKATSQGSDIIKILVILSSVGLLISLMVSFVVFVSLKKSLSSVLNSTSASVENSFKIVEELSLRTHDLTKSTDSQLEAVHNSVHTLSEITVAIALTSQNAQESLHSAEAVLEKANEGQEVMGKMQTAVGEIQSATARFEEVLATIKAIGARTSTINDIVERTQMLSFNATLEAERAGEQGKAFGIVAQEVGKLAEISGKASQEIEKLIHDGESKVAEVLAQIQKRVSVGSAVTKDSVAVFNEISKRIEMINGQIREISDAAKQQDQSAQLVTKSMKEIDHHSVNNAETTKQVTATSDDLKNESQKLNSAVGDLRFLIVGSEAAKTV